MSITLTAPVTLKDTLNNMAPGAGESNFAKGVLVGVVGTLMAAGLSFADAIKLASDHAPKRVMFDSVPPSWFEDFGITDPPTAAGVWVRSRGVGE